MSTIIDATKAVPRTPMLKHAAAALCGWATLLLAITALGEPTRDVLVFGQPDATLPLLDGSDTRIVDIGAYSLTLRGTARGFVRALYANGAWLVVPVRAGGCLSSAEITARLPARRATFADDDKW